MHYTMLITSDLENITYSEIFLINNCQCQNEVKNHTVPP
jgi:hypothetical protein